MTLQIKSWGGTGLRCWVVVAAWLVLGGCANSAGQSPGNPAEVSVSGHLTRKGSAPGDWWAVTDDRGQVWKLVSPTPLQLAAFEKAQNHRVRVDGHRQAKYLSLEQIQPVRVMALP